MNQIRHFTNVSPNKRLKTTYTSLPPSDQQIYRWLVSKTLKFTHNWQTLCIRLSCPFTESTVPRQWPIRDTLITVISVCSTVLLWLFFFLGRGKFSKSFIFWEGLTVKGAGVFFGLTASSTTNDPINTRVQDAKTFLKMKRIALQNQSSSV